MQESFIRQYLAYQVEFRRDYVSSKDIWYNVSVLGEGKNLQFRMHNNENRTWKITGKRITPLLLRMEEDFSEAIDRNELKN